MTSNVRLSDLTTLRNWQLGHVAKGGELFKTFASLEWFIRQHRDQLIASGSLIPQRGSRPTLVTTTFDDAVCNILVCGARS